jgi:hypothetical protein
MKIQALPHLTPLCARARTHTHTHTHTPCRLQTAAGGWKGEQREKDSRPQRRCAAKALEARGYQWLHYFPKTRSVKTILVILPGALPASHTPKTTTTTK